MTAVGIVFFWVAFTAIACVALSAAALAKTHGELEVDLRVARESELTEARRETLGFALGESRTGTPRRATRARGRALTLDSLARRLPAARPVRPIPFAEWRSGATVSLYGASACGQPSAAGQVSTVHMAASPAGRGSL